MSIQLNVNVVTVSGATATVKGAAPSPTNDDFIKGSSGQDVISAGDGNDRVWAGAGADYVDGGAGDDVLYGEAGDDILKGGQGNDRLDGGADNDIMFGDEGNDWIWGGSGNDIAYGGVGNDYLWGGVGSDLMYGDDGNDHLWGEAGDDVMFGGAGNDLLNGGAGNDALSGGVGRDTFQYWIDNSQRGLNFGALWGSDRITDFASGPSGDLIDMRTLFERLSDADVQKILTIVDSLVNESTGQYNNINLDLPGVTFKLGSGVSAVAELTTLGGDQVSFSFVAQDVNGVKDVQIGIKNLSVAGDAGATIKLEGSGNLQALDFIRETMKAVHGTNGSDTYNSASFDFAGSKGVKLYGFGGDDVLDMGASSKRVEFFGGEGSDSVSGGSAGDWLQGDNGDDVIYGFGGNDALHGGSGADNLYGGDGADNLSGGGGNDALFGEAGNDILFGGGGADTLTGGAGNDTFLIGGTVRVDWDAGKAFFNINAGSSSITDFSAGDKIKFADFIPNWSLQSADLRQKFVDTWFQDHAKKSGADLVISGDNNGAASGGEWSINVQGRADIYDDLTDGSFNYADYFLFA